MRRTAQDVERKRQRRMEAAELLESELLDRPELYEKCPEWCEFHSLTGFWLHQRAGVCLMCNEETANTWHVARTAPNPPRLCKWCSGRWSSYSFRPVSIVLMDRAMRAASEWETLNALRECGFPLPAIETIAAHLGIKYKILW